MATIDADAHVVENEKTWSYVDDSVRDSMPVLVSLPGGTRNALMWALDGRLAATGPVSQTDAIKEDRELDDVAARVRHMDELSTDIQVIYPTIFLRPLTNKPELEVLLARSYNRWLAERCQQASDRLRWAVVPPTRTIDAAIEELRFGAEHGACAVFWRGIEGDKLPGNAYFNPISMKRPSVSGCRSAFTPQQGALLIMTCWMTPASGASRYLVSSPSITSLVPSCPSASRACASGLSS